MLFKNEFCNTTLAVFFFNGNITKKIPRRLLTGGGTEGGGNGLLQMLDRTSLPRQQKS